MSPKKQRFHKSIPVYRFTVADEWLEWLANKHSQTEAIWIQFAKKNSGVASITYEEAREGALRFGWIDGLINSWDDKFYLTRFCQRRPRSKWSLINRNIVEGLIESGRMMPSGMALVNAAKQDGRWDAAYSSQSVIQIPDDLQERLNKNSKARNFFESLSNSKRYSFLYRIENAKRPETRQKWIDRTIELLSQEKTFHPQVRKKR